MNPTAFEEELNRRLARFLAVSLLMLTCGMAALGRIATTLKSRAADAHCHAGRR